MPYIDFKIVKGNVIGLVLPKPQSDTDAKTQQSLTDFLTSKVNTILRLYFDKKKSDGYIRKKFHLLLELALKHLPEYIIKEIIGEIDLASKEHGLENLKSILMLETGFSYPVIAKVNGGRNTLVQIRKKTSQMDDEEFARCYARVRDKLFDYCKQQYPVKVGETWQIFEPLSDYVLFEAFGCLYLGIPFKEMELVEKQLENLDLSQTINYLMAIKQLGKFITTDMWANSKTQ